MLVREVFDVAHDGLLEDASDDEFAIRFAGVGGGGGGGAEFAVVREHLLESDHRSVPDLHTDYLKHG